MRHAQLAQTAAEPYLHTVERGHPHVQEHTIQNRHGDKLESKTRETDLKQWCRDLVRGRILMEVKSELKPSMQHQSSLKLVSAFSSSTDKSLSLY